MPYALATIADLKAYELARMADCASPDSLESPGAKLLLSVRDSVAEYLRDNPEEDPEDALEAILSFGDEAPDVYTYQRWKEFVDLGAWTEDIADLDPDPSDLTELAGLALQQIGRRLAEALLRTAQTDE